MATVKITKHTVAGALPRLSPKSARYVIFDSEVTGFGLRVYPTGKKSWIFEYRPHPGGSATPKKTTLIGSVDDFTPDQARKVADTLRSIVMTGGDPQANKNEARGAPTVSEVADAFILQHVKAKRSATTVALYRDILDRIILPKVGQRKARDLKGREISALHQEWAAHPYQANRILAVIGSMYGWASGPVALVPEGSNPTRGIERFLEKQRGSVLSTEELERLGAAIRLAETVGVAWTLNPDAKAKHRAKSADARLTKIGQHPAAAIRLLILTGMRLSEVLNLRWSQIDFEQGLILLAVHKTARTSGVKAVVLNAPALAVLNGLSRVGVYVIAGETAGQKDERPRHDLKKPWAMIRRAAGLEDLRIHDLRHNFGGFGAGGGMGLPIIGKLLGHSQPATTARYAHFDNDPIRRATNTIGSALAAAMGDAPAADKNNVVPLKRTQ